MSQFAKSGGDKTPPSSKSTFTIKDTEFLLRLLTNSAIPGVDLEVASSTKKKLEEYHKTLMNKEVNLNG